MQLEMYEVPRNLWSCPERVLNLCLLVKIGSEEAVDYNNYDISDGNDDDNGYVAWSI